MAWQLGQTVTASGNYQTHQVAGGGGQAYDMGAGTSGVVKDMRMINGQQWLDVDYSKGSGGGTGWVNASAFAAPAATTPSAVAAQQQAATIPQANQPSASQQQLTSFLKQFEQRANDALAKENLLFDTLGKQNAALIEAVNSNPYPEAIDYAAKWGEMRQQYGVGELESNLNTLNAQMAEIEAEMANSGMQTLMGTGNRSVAMGRLSEKQQQLQIRADFIGRQQSRIVDQLNSANGVISMMMQFTQQGYQDAVAQYNTQLQTQLQMHQIFSSQTMDLLQMTQSERLTNEGRVLDLQTQLVEWEREDIRQQQQMALAHIEMYTNLLTSGNIKYDSLSAQDRLNINKLEIQAGLPQGFMASIKSNREVEGNKMLGSNTRVAPDGTQYVDMIWQAPDGRIWTQAQATGKVAMSGGSGGGSDVKFKDQVTSATRLMSTKISGTSGDRYIDANEARIYADNLFAIYNDYQLVDQIMSQVFADEAKKENGLRKYKW